MIELLFLLLIASIVLVAQAVFNFKKKWTATIRDKTIIDLYEQGELKRPWRFEVIDDQSFAYWHILLFLSDDVAPVMGFDDVGSLVYRWDSIWEQQWLAVREKVLQYSEQNRKLLKKVGFNNGLKNDVDFCSLLKKMSELRHIDTPIEKHMLLYNEKTLEDFHTFTFWNCLANGQPLPRFNDKKWSQDDAKDQLEYYQRKWSDKYYAKIEAVAHEFYTYKGAFDFSFFLREICTIKKPYWERVTSSGDGMRLYVKAQSIVLVSPNVITFLVRADYTPMSKSETILLQQFKKQHTSKWEKISYIIETCSINCEEKTFIMKEYTIFTYDGEELAKEVSDQKPQQIPSDDPYSSLGKIYAYVMNHIEKAKEEEAIENENLYGDFSPEWLDDDVDTPWGGEEETPPEVKYFWGGDKKAGRGPA